MEKLGIESNLLIAQIVNFLIIVFVLNRLLYKPILKMLEDRKKKIRDGLEYTETMRKESEAMELKKKALIEKAQKEIQLMIDEAKITAKEEYKRIIEEAQKEADAIIMKGKRETEMQKIEMKRTIRDDAVDLAVSMAKRLLSGIITEDVQQALIKKHIHALKSL